MPSMSTTQAPDGAIHGWTMDFNIPGLSLDGLPTSTPPTTIHTGPPIETLPSISTQSQDALPSVVHPPSTVHQLEYASGSEEGMRSTVYTPSAEDLDGPEHVASESSVTDVPPDAELDRPVGLSMTAVVSPWVRDTSRNSLFDTTYWFLGVPCVAPEQDIMPKTNDVLFSHHRGNAY